MTSLRNLFRLAVLFAFPIALALLAAPDQSERVVVVSIAGDWKFDNARVNFGQSLPANGCLFGSDGSVVLQLDKKPNPSAKNPENPAQPFVCEKPSRHPDCSGHDADRCAVPLDPTKWKSKGTLGDAWRPLRELFLAEPEKYMVAASRGLEPGLVDSVVSLQGQNLDLSPAFRDMPSASYSVKFSPVHAPPIADSTLDVQFTSHAPAVVVMPLIQPGLYRLVLVDKIGAPAGSDCWILVSPGANFTTVSNMFQAAVQKSSTWPDDMDPSATRALLRAYLESLAISAPKNTP